jgi:hypothetical protein
MLKLEPYFRADAPDASKPLWPGSGYVAGWREPGMEHGPLEVVLPADVVDRVVLQRAQLAVSVLPNGLVVVDVDGLDDEAVDDAWRNGVLCERPISDLVAAAVSLGSLRSTEAPIADMTSLRDELRKALSIVETALSNHDAD